MLKRKSNINHSPHSVNILKTLSRVTLSVVPETGEKLLDALPVVLDQRSLPGVQFPVVRPMCCGLDARRYLSRSMRLEYDEILTR